MPPTRQEVQNAINRQTMHERSINADLLKVAAVRAEELTGHPAWDHFLTRLQAMLDAAEQEKATWIERCCDAYKDEDVRFAQRNVTAYTVQADLLRQIMAMPQEVVKEYATESGRSANA